MFSKECFEKAALKILGNFGKTFVVEFSFNEITRVQCTIYYRPINFTTDAFLKRRRKEKMF